MKRIINKILDNYYADKLIKECRDVVMLYNLDCISIDVGSMVYINVKPRAYKDEYYKVVFRFNKKNALKWFCNLEELEKVLREELKEYKDKFY